MATEEAQKKTARTAYIFDVDSIPIPPGTKCRSKLWRGPGADPRLLIGRLTLGMIICGAIAVGILIGRLLVP